MEIGFVVKNDLDSLNDKWKVLYFREVSGYIDLICPSTPPSYVYHFILRVRAIYSSYLPLSLHYISIYILIQLDSRYDIFLSLLEYYTILAKLF